MAAALENDPEKLKLRQELKDHETSQAATMKVISELGEEITQLKDKIERMDVIVAEEKEKQGKLMKKHESKYAEMEKEQEELKALLHMEMTKAERGSLQEADGPVPWFIHKSDGPEHQDLPHSDRRILNVECSSAPRERRKRSRFSGLPDSSLSTPLFHRLWRRRYVVVDVVVVVVVLSYPAH